MSGPSLQQRFEESAFGRGILSVLIVITLVAIVAINLPQSQLRHDLLRPGQPFLNATGLDQNWALFAPDPRRIAIDVSAVVVFRQGKPAVWRFPHDGSVVGTYRDYRWRKWEENLINPANSILWRPAALWAASSESMPGRIPKTVYVVERFAAIEPPGVTPSTGPVQQRIVYTLHLTSPTATKPTATKKGKAKAKARHGGRRR